MFRLLLLLYLVIAIQDLASNLVKFKMHDGFTWDDGLVSLGRQSVQEKEKFDSKQRIDGTR